MLTIVGIGPGKKEGMTLEAYQALEQSDCIVGYTVYVELVRELFPDKEYYTTPMTKEVERCQWAIAQARAGLNIAMVCSGDSGVYGMAGLICELAGDAMAKDMPELAILPGVTAACSGAAILGAPLTHDFAVISLSDRLTPWETIKRRLQAAVMGDFVICLYNPASKGRPDYLQKACDILLEAGMADDRVCGVARHIGREGQSREVMTLRQLHDFPADMFTTVYIGNSMTRRYGDRMVTPRGYQKDVKI
ncbi:MAG: precorrin-3B C(17)-methyltransferase [Lachnospiraceae bacterium]|nr:precorrin-3B C(17)-methyltransferase [Lachnospiraceae bacterium]